MAETDRALMWRIDCGCVVAVGCGEHADEAPFTRDNGRIGSRRIWPRRQTIETTVGEARAALAETFDRLKVLGHAWHPVGDCGWAAYQRGLAETTRA